MLLRRLASLFGLFLFSAFAAPLGPLPRDPAILKYPALQPVVTETGGDGRTLLVSDSPEAVPSPGLLYRDTVQGAARVLAYHVNALQGLQPARLLIEATNTGPQALTLTRTRVGAALTAGPDPLIGQQTLLRYFASRPAAERRLAPGTSLNLYLSGPVSAGQVVSVMLDVSASAPLRLSVYLLGAGGRPGPETPVLPPDGVHQRGTFAGADRRWQVTLPVAAGPSRLMFGDASDPPLAGTDALTGRAQHLKGNFGVLYDLTLEGATGALLASSARGGPYRGAVQLQDGPGRTPLLIGRGRALTDSAQPEALWHARSDTLRLWIVPANGSNLPLALVVYPVGAGPTPQR